MATRTISTKLAVEGESEYRSSISRINGEIKTLQSALKLTESEFQSNANSMEALTAKGDALSKLYSAQKDKVEELQKALDNARDSEKLYGDIKQELEEQIKANNEALEKLKESTGDTTAEQERLTEENKELNAELERNEGYLTAAGKGVTSWQDKLNTAKVKLNDLDAELKLNDKYMEEARQSADGCATSIDEFGDRVKESADKSTDLRDALAAAGVIKALEMTAEALKACAEASIEFESAMAGVSKTTDLTDSDLAAMGDEIQELATKIPATAVEIANVAEAAGQLGIAKEDLLDFSEVMINLGTSTNLTSTEAASSLAKFANVVDMSADNYEHLGSTIVALGNNFATTEADIVSMATRIASTGELVGLTEPQIMAVATALSSVGIEAEAGGSAVSKLLKQFETMVATGSPALADFAAVAGMSAEEFSSAWGENAVGALGAFIDGLGAVDAAGGSSVAVLNDLGITETRLSNAVLAMASSNGVLTDALNTANTAWEENSALAKEAATRYETTESKLQLLANAADNVKIAVGDQLTPAIGELAETGVDVLSWLGDFIEDNEAVVPVLTATATTVGVLAVGLTGYSAASAAAAAATKAFNKILDTNPIFLAVTAVAALAAGLGVLVATVNDSAVQSVSDLTTAANDLTAAMEATSTTRETEVETTMAAASVAEGYIARLQELEGVSQRTDEQQKEYHDTLAMLCQVVPELSGYIDLENDAIQGGTDALLANTEAWKNNALAQAYQKELAALYDQYGDVLIEAEKNRIGLTTAEEKAETASRNMSGTYQALLDTLGMTDAQFKSHYGTVRDIPYATCSEQVARLREDYLEYESQLAAANAETETYQEAIEAGAEATTAAEEAIAQTEAAVKNLTAAEEANTQAAGENAVAQGDLTEAQEEAVTPAEELAAAYQEAYDAARQSIEGQIGLFDDFAATVSEDTDTIEEMMTRWAEQTANLASYTENLKKAAEYGIDDGLVLALSDGSAESAGYLATIIQGFEDAGVATKGLNGEVDDFVAEFNASFAETQIAKDEFAETVSTMEKTLGDAVESMETTANESDFSGISEETDQVAADVKEDAQSIGEEFGPEIAAGMENSSGTVADSAASLTEDAIEAAYGPIDSDAAAVGEGLVDEIQTGVGNEQPVLEGVLGDLGGKILDILTGSATDSVDSYLEEFSKISNKTKSELAELKETITLCMAPLPGSMYTVGQDMINGAINGVNNRAGALYGTVRSVVNGAISEAKKAAAVNSPSKKTTEIFECVGDGMVVGLENRRAKVKETAQSVVNDALDLDVDGKVKSAINSIDATIPVELNSAVMRASAATTDTSGVQHNYGGFVFQIYQQPGEDAETLAYRVMDIMQMEVSRKGGSIGG